MVIRDGDLWQLPADFWDRLAAEIEQNCPILERLQELRTDCAEEAEALHAEDILRTGETIFGGRVFVWSSIVSYLGLPVAVVLYPSLSHAKPLSRPIIPPHGRNDR